MPFLQFALAYVVEKAWYKKGRYEAVRLRRVMCVFLSWSVLGIEFGMSVAGCREH